MKLVRIVALLAVVVALSAPSVEAQGYPWPTMSGEPLAICPESCASSSEGLPLYPYSLPVKRHVGRLTDSQSTRDYQAGSGMRTLRARGAFVSLENNRVYLMQGQVFAAYDLNTFFTSDVGSALKNVTASREGAPEQYLGWKYGVYPEARGSGWSTPVVDGQDRLYDADFDDRGYIHLAYSIFGWGIVKDSGSSMPLVKQTFTSVGATKVMAVKVGTKYYAFITNYLSPSATDIYDVTVPSAPVFLRQVSVGAYSWAKAKTSTGYDIALVNDPGQLLIYDAADFIAGRSPKQTLNALTDAEFRGVGSDGTDFFTGESSPSRPQAASYAWLERNGSTYRVHRTSLGNFLVHGARFNSGYLSLWGYDNDNKAEIRLLRFSGGTFTAVDTKQFFKRYYSAPPTGYAKPSGYTGKVKDVLVVRSGGKDYVIHSQHGLGDVYELQTSATPVMPDPEITTSGCVYVGRSCTLTATSESGEDRTGWTYSWKNGAGTVVGTSASYSPTFSTEGSYTFTVDATNTVGTAQDSITLNIIPVPPPTVPDPTISKSGCDIVGSSCTLSTNSASGKDQSDWNYEWRRTGSTTVLGTSRTYSPSTTSLGAGTFEFNVTASNTAGSAQASTTFTLVVSTCTGGATDADIAISWKGTVTGCTRTTGGCPAGESIKFTAQEVFRYTFQDCDTFSWNFGDGTTGSGEVVTHTYSRAGTFTAKLTVKNSTQSTGAVTTSTVTIGGGDSEPACPSTAPSGISVNFDGGISNCSASSNNCETNESVKFIPKASGYTFQDCDTYLWTFHDGTTSTSKNPTKKYTSLGDYAVTLKVTNTKGTDTDTGTVRVTTTGTGGDCSAYPIDLSLGMSYTGSVSKCSASGGGTCAVNEEIDFLASIINYTLKDCDTIEWDFGDGSAGITDDRSVTHRYAQAGTYTAVFTLRNSTGTKTVSKPVNVGTTGGGVAPSNVSFTATPSSPKIGQAVQFSATADGTVTSWAWTIDGASKSGQNVTHTFSTAGTRNVTVVANNANGSASRTLPITVSSSSSFAYLLPSVAHLPGAQDSQWRTDLQMYNPTPSTTEPLVLDLEFRSRSGATATKRISTSASSLTIEDVLKEVIPDVTNDAGLIILRGDGAAGVQFWTRTYTLDAAGTGTFGQLVPAIPIGTTQAATSGDTVLLLGGLENPSTTTGNFRTNVGFVNPTPTDGSVHIEVFDESDNFLLGEFDLPVAAFGFKQIGNSEIRTSIPSIGDAPYRFSLRISSDISEIVAYASIIDQISNDPVYIAATPEGRTSSPSYGDQSIPAIRVGSWRSDLTLYNPGPGVEVALDFHDRTGARVSGSPSNIRIGSNEFLRIEDLLTAPELAPALLDSLGVVRIRTMAPVDASVHPIVFGRNYNIGDGLHGTFGHETVAIPQGGGNVRAGSPSVLPSLRSNLQPVGELVGSSYYTNLNLFSLSDEPTTVVATLLDDLTGLAIGTYQLPQQIPGRGTIVIPDILRAAHPADEGITDLRGTLKLEIIGGPIYAFASVIDWKTKDAVAVPASPVN